MASDKVRAPEFNRVHVYSFGQLVQLLIGHQAHAPDATGEVVELGRESLETVRGDAEQSRRQQLTSELVDLLSREADVIAAHQPRSLVNRCGYQLAGVPSDPTSSFATSRC